ncbi:MULTISPECIES: protelomerase family protein [unclassified Leptolyngbya]|uniref:protelomerase family protein n=1 Tax=unclassified Leptolyngbya TaxID=2650499 RepID=UPI001687CAC2|nr:MULTISPECIES: protelomerase family protein [unclassified Leptolyngbya]MBD1908994.1 hypothetical protein [Leptolyngbya sp. FACHB-8]MBD2153021.1 hypothetical protein [Leptolyngbya sp. FACHB-16]
MGTRSWLNKQIQSEIIPAIAYLNNTPQGRRKAQTLTQELRDGWAKRGFTQPAQQKPLFDELRRVIRAKFGDDHFSLDYFKLSRDEHFAINQQNQSNARDRQIHQQYLDNPDEIVATAVRLLDSPEWADITAGLAVLTGRRLNEVLKTAQFNVVSQWVVRFSGALKRQGEEVPLVFDIPTLTTAKRVIQATERLRQITPPGANESKVALASDHHFHQLVPAPHGKTNLYAHLWRSVYCCIATFWYCPKHVDDLLFKAHILGHFETLTQDEQKILAHGQQLNQGKLRQRLENFASDRHYRLYEIDDKVIAQYNGQRKGIKLGYGSIQPIEAFTHGLPEHQPEPIKRKTPSSLRVWKEDHNAISSILSNFPGNTQPDKVSSWINWSLEQILKGKLSTPTSQHQAHDQADTHQAHDEAHTITPQTDSYNPHPGSSLEFPPAPDTSTIEQSHHQAADDAPPPLLPEPEESLTPAPTPTAAAANPLESKLDQLLDVMTLFVQGQMQQQPGTQKRAINPNPSTPQPLTPSESESDTSEKTRRYKTGEADGIINRAIDAIIAHNNAPGRLHDDKWAISINGLKNYSLNQRAIERITQERKDEIQQHHALHQLGARHNDRHKRKFKINQVITL